MNTINALQSTGWRFWKSRPVQKTSLTLTVMLAVGAAFYFFSDGPAPDDTDLVPPHYAEVPEGHSLAILRNVWFKTKKTFNFLDARLPYEPARIQGFRYRVTHDHPALEAYDRLMKIDHRTWKWGGLTKGAYPDPRDFIPLIQSRNHLYAADGQPEKSVQGTIELLKFIRGLESAEGDCYVQYQMHSAAKHVLNDLTKFLIEHPWSSSDLEATQKELAALEPSLSALQSLTCIIYKELREICYNTGGCRNGHDYPPQVFSRLRFKPNLTCAFAAAHLGKFHDALNIGWAEAHKMDEVPPATWLRYNPTGTLWLQDGDPWRWLRSSFSDRIWSVTRQRQLVIALALRRHELDHQRLPPFLEDLVPKYLNAIPIDPYSNQPLQWLPKQRIIYSFGNNCLDDNGVPRSLTTWRADDMVMDYWKIPSS